MERFTLHPNLFCIASPPRPRFWEEGFAADHTVRRHTRTRSVCQFAQAGISLRASEPGYVYQSLLDVDCA